MATQLVPLQQPFGQEVVVQAHLPALHVCPLTHGLPHSPQLLVSVWRFVATQVVPLQQPFVQELAVQAHLPALQICPVAQAWPHVPQLLLSV